jgi:protein ImuB
MERTLCVWYPDWALRRPDTPPDEPAQAVAADNRVVAVNAGAAAAGVVVGMRRREAEAICPTIVTVVADPGAEAAAFEPVAVAVETLVPRIEIAAPGLLFVPIAGAVRYYGNEETLVAAVVAALDGATGGGYRVGVAAGPFTAHRAAEQATVDVPVCRVTDDAAFLRSLDVTAVGSEDLAATFRWLGITTLGELAALPREAMLSRFGGAGLAAHRIATGEDRDPRPRRVPPDLAIEERFSPALESLEQAAFVGRALAHRLLSDPALRGAIPHRVIVEAEAADGTIRTRTWRNADPFDETTLAERVRWQLRAWLDEARARNGPGIHGGVVRLRLSPADLSDRGRQLALHEDARGAAEAHRTLVQTQAIVGPESVVQAVPQGGRDPGERVAWHRWDDAPPGVVRDPAAPWPGAIPAPSPALAPPDPPQLEVDWDDGMPVRIRLGSRWVPVVSWAGPWRKMGRWWDGGRPADRYQIVTSAGAFLCEVREGRTYLTGVYD